VLKTVQQGDSEPTLLYANSDSISTRYLKTAETVRELSQLKFGNEEQVKLVVVTKGKPLSACLEVIAAGATNLGENYPEETVKKFTDVDLRKINLHMIGHIQSRKIKLLQPLFQCIHSIDNQDLARKVSDHYRKKEKKVDVLIEVDFTSEQTKRGFRVDDSNGCDSFMITLGELLRLDGINVIGLMTMGHYPENEEINRNIFKACTSLLNTIQEKFKVNAICELSMGTSGDYKTAIAEGSTMVRIGESIMGPRSYL
jgi:hypothetical protein